MESSSGIMRADHVVGVCPGCAHSWSASGQKQTSKLEADVRLVSGSCHYSPQAGELLASKWLWPRDYPPLGLNSRTTNRCRRKRQDPKSSNKRDMAPNMDRRDSHGSIPQAHLPDAQSEGGAGPTMEWDNHCKRD